MKIWKTLNVYLMKDMITYVLIYKFNIYNTKLKNKK